MGLQMWLVHCCSTVCSNNYGTLLQVSGVAGFLAAREVAAADAAAISMLLMGILRCILLQLPGAAALLGAEEDPKNAEINESAEEHAEDGS